MDWKSLLIGSLIGAIPAGMLGWLTAHIYYNKTSRELEQELINLKEILIIKIHESINKLILKIEESGVNEKAKKILIDETTKLGHSFQSKQGELFQDVELRLRDYLLRSHFDIIIEGPIELADVLMIALISKFSENCTFAKIINDEHRFTIRVWPRIGIKHEGIKYKINKILDEFKGKGISFIKFTQ